MMPYDITKLAEHWFKEWFSAWWHLAITWANVDLPSVSSFRFHQRPVLQEMIRISVLDMSYNITYLKL